MYTHYDEFDNACLTMVKHPAVAFEHVKFKETIAKVTNSEVYYKAIGFYLEYAPTLLVDMLTVVLSHLDHVRVVLQLRKAKLLHLVKDYLLKVQADNIKEVRAGGESRARGMSRGHLSSPSPPSPLLFLPCSARHVPVALLSPAPRVVRSRGVPCRATHTPLSRCTPRSVVRCACRAVSCRALRRR